MLRLRWRQLAERIVSPAKLERPGPLEILTFKKDRSVDDGVEGARGHHRRPVGDAVEALRRRDHIVIIDLERAELFGRAASFGGGKSSHQCVVSGSLCLVLYSS